MRFQKKWLRDRRGARRAFTIVELLVVIAIMALFSTLAITYSNVGRNEVALTVEESKISQFILQAKQLSLTTYSTGQSSSCGFGLMFDLATSSAQPYQTYSIFAYSPNVTTGPTCPSLASTTAHLENDGIATSPPPPAHDEEQKYTDGTWNVPVSHGVVVQSVTGSADPTQNSLMAILFYPPEPTVFLSSDGTTFPANLSSLIVSLQTIDGKNSETLTVNSEGQITF
jgi:prepilin-type N-terminal cleavage/methylation domain-containing protein